MSTLTRQDVEELLKPLQSDLRLILNDVATLKTDVAVITTEMATMKHDIQVLSAKQSNSTKGRDEALDHVPFPLRAEIVGEGVMPPSLAHLAVAGNETLPNGDRNTWNARKSKDLLKTYGDQSESEGEVEESHPTARKRRIRLARCIGITAAQLNSANTIL